MSQKGSLPPNLLAHLSSRSRDLSGVRMLGMMWSTHIRGVSGLCLRSGLVAPLDRKGTSDLWPR
jgi:hypothetical protein